MADYRALRKRYSLLEICRQPELAVAVTLQPVDAIDVDAAILFSDLLIPFTPLGLDFDFVKGEGPSIHYPIRTRRPTSDRLRQFEPREALAHVLETIRLLRRELHDRVPLIGFGGAPFTLAAYAIEGGPSTTYARTKQFMYAQPAGVASSSVRAFADADCRLHARAGRSRRAGDPDLRLVGRRARPQRLPRVRAAAHAARSSSGLRDTGVPLIHFGVGATAILEDLAEAGGDVIGLDWRQPLDEAWARLPGRAVQGNLDPLRCSVRASACSPRPTTCCARRRPAGPHLQSRPRHPAADARSSTSRSSRTGHVLTNRPDAGYG